MAITSTPRLALPQWGSGGDSPPTRAGLNSAFASIETNAAKFGVGPISSRPAASAATSGMVWQTPDYVSFCDGTKWLTVQGGGAEPSPIVNASFTVWDYAQTNEPISVTSGFKWVAPRWSSFSNGTATMQQIIDGEVPNLQWNTISGMSQVIHHLDYVAKWHSSRITISAEIKAGSGTVGMYLARVYGPGGSPTDFPAPLAQIGPLTTSWQRYAWVFDVPAAGNIGTGVPGIDSKMLLTFQRDTPGLVQFRDVQVDEGGVAQPFRRKHPAQDAIECARYHRRIYAAEDEGLGMWGTRSLNVPGKATFQHVFHPRMIRKPIVTMRHAGISNGASIVPLPRNPTNLMNTVENNYSSVDVARVRIEGLTYIDSEEPVFLELVGQAPLGGMSSYIDFQAEL